MKKFLLLIGLSFCIYSYPQDDLELYDGSLATTMESDAEMFFWRVVNNDTIIYRIRGSYINPIWRVSSELYPRSTSYNLTLGTNTNPYSYRLNVSGSGYFSSNVKVGNQIQLGNGHMSYSGSNLYFYDETVGLKSLADLSAGGSSTMLARNGLLINGGYAELGSSLIENTTIETGSYTFKVGYGSNTFLSINPNIFSLIGATAGYIQSDNLSISANDGFVLRNHNGVSMVNEFIDNYAPYYGLNMPDWQLYYNNIRNDNVDAALITYGMAKDISRIYGGGSVSMTYQITNGICYEDGDTIGTESGFTYNPSTDLLSIPSATIVDSLWLPYLEDEEGEEQWLLLTSSAGVGADSLSDAGLMAKILKFIPGPIWRYFVDRKRDTITGYMEIAWYNKEGEKEYSIKTPEKKKGGKPSETIYKLQSAAEISARHTAWNRILIIFLIISNIYIIRTIKRK